MSDSGKGDAAAFRVGPRHRAAAYWFWSSVPDPDTMRRQLADFRDRGFATILIQARLSMPRALYLSDAFLRGYAEALRIIAELGLSAGLYDDYNWASGQAGGRTVEGADHLRERHLFWATVQAPAGGISGIRPTLAASLGPAAAEWLYDGGEARFDDWDLVAALLHRERPADGPIRDVTGEDRADRGRARRLPLRLRRQAGAG